MAEKQIGELLKAAAKIDAAMSAVQPPNPGCGICGKPAEILTRYITGNVSFGQTCGSDSCKIAHENAERVGAWFRSCSGFGVPTRYECAALIEFGDMAEQAEKARKRMSHSGGVLIGGPNGSGKTHLAAALVRAHFEAGENSMRWALAPAVLLEIRGTYRDRADCTEADVVAKYTAPRVLVLDDFGAEKVSDWSMSALYVVLSTRVDALKPTIVTTNLSLREIHAYEPRIASRLGGFEQLHFAKTARDRRLSK